MKMTIQERLKAALEPPITADTTPQQAYMINILWVTLCGNILVAVLLLLTTIPADFSSVYIMRTVLSAYALLQFPLIRWLRQGKLQRVSLSLVAELWLVIVISAYFSGGVYSTSIMLMILPLILATSLLQVRQATIVYLFSGIAIGILLMIEMLGLLPSAPSRDIPYRIMMLGITFTTVYSVTMNQVREMRMMEYKNIELSARSARLNVQNELARNVAHDLRTPITVLTMQVYLLRQKMAKNMPFDQHVERLDLYVQNLSHTIENLLQLTWFNNETENEHWHWQFVELEDLWNKVIQVRLPYSAEREISIQLENQCGGACQMMGQLDFLQQAFSELLNNSIYYGKPGGSTQVRFACTDSHVTITVADDGIGIEESLQEAIFEPFVRGDDARTGDNHIGSGIGLAIVKQIVKLHEGTIQLQSEPGQGTTITLTFPRTDRAKRASTAASSPE